MADSAGASRKRGILLATILGSSLAFLDMSIVNVILPRIQSEFGRNLDVVQWVIEAYGLFLTTFLLLGGALGDRYGRRRLFLIGLLVFLGGSAGCALSPTFEALLLARALQGLGAALLTPGSLAIINASFPAEERGQAVGTWSALSAIVGAVGPPLGGFLSDRLGWRSAFAINIPLGLVTFIAAWRSIPRDRVETSSASLDYKGTAASTAGLGVLIFALTQRSVPAAAFGLLLLGGFLRIESRAAAPLLPLSAFQSRTFSMANLFTLVLYGAVSAAFFYLPVHLISVEGWSSGSAGLALLPMVLLIFALSPAAGALLPRLSAPRMLTLGPLVSASGFLAIAVLARPEGSYWRSYFPGLCLFGLGMGVTVAPLTAVAVSSLGDARSGLASGVNNAAARLAGLFGVACAAWGGTVGFSKLRGVMLGVAALCAAAAALGAGLSEPA